MTESEIAAEYRLRNLDRAERLAIDGMSDAFVAAIAQGDFARADKILADEITLAIAGGERE